MKKNIEFANEATTVAEQTITEEAIVSKGMISLFINLVDEADMAAANKMEATIDLANALGLEPHHDIEEKNISYSGSVNYVNHIVSLHHMMAARREAVLTLVIAEQKNEDVFLKTIYFK